MVQPKVIKTAVITTSVVAIGLGVGLTVGRSKSNEPPSSVQSDGGSPDVEYVDPSPKVSKDFMPLVTDPVDGDVIDTIDKAQRYSDVTGPEGAYTAYGDGEVSDVTDRQGGSSKANKGESGSGDGKSSKSNIGSPSGSHHGVKCIGSGKSSKSNSDGKSGKSNSNAGKSGKSNSRMLRGNRQLSSGGKSGKSGGTHDEWEGEEWTDYESHKSWSSSSSTKWSSESTKWSSSSSGDWKGVENDWHSSGKSVSLLYPYLYCSWFFVVDMHTSLQLIFLLFQYNLQGKSGHSDWGSSGKSGKSGHDDPSWEASWSSSSSDWGSVHVSAGKSGKSGHHDPASWGSHSWSEPSWSHSSWSVDWVDCDPPSAKSSKSKSSKSKSGKAFTSKSSQAPTVTPPATTTQPSTSQAPSVTVAIVVPDPTSSPTPAPTQCSTVGNSCGNGNGECCGGLTCNGKICVAPKVFISTPEPSSSPTEGCEIIPESVKFCGTDDFTGCSVEGIVGDECDAASDADKGYDCESKSFYAPNSAGSETDGDCLKYTCDGSGNLSFMKNAFFDVVSRQCSCCPPPPEPPLVIVETDEPTMTPTTPSPTACSEDRVWYDNGSVCTNDGEFNEQSDTTFASMKLCCENTFGTNGQCRFEDVCFTPAPTDEVSLLYCYSRVFLFQVVRDHHH